MLFAMGQLTTPGLPPHADWLADPYASMVNAHQGLQFIFLAVLHDQQFVENWLRVFPSAPFIHSQGRASHSLSSKRSLRHSSHRKAKT